MNICTYVYMYLFMYLCIYIYLDLYMYICIFASIHLCIFGYMKICICECVFLSGYVLMYVFRHAIGGMGALIYGLLAWKTRFKQFVLIGQILCLTVRMWASVLL